MIPDYILKKSFRVEDKPGKVTVWIEIHEPPDPLFSWKSYLQARLTAFASSLPTETLGFRIHARFYNSMYLEDAFDTKPRSSPVGEEPVGYTVVGVPVKWKM